MYLRVDFIRQSIQSGPIRKRYELVLWMSNFNFEVSIVQHSFRRFDKKILKNRLFADIILIILITLIYPNPNYPISGMKAFFIPL